jgi:hypothetical protein
MGKFPGTDRDGNIPEPFLSLIHFTVSVHHKRWYRKTEILMALVRSMNQFSIIPFNMIGVVGYPVDYFTFPI